MERHRWLKLGHVDTIHAGNTDFGLAVVSVLNAIKKCVVRIASKLLPQCKRFLPKKGKIETHAPLAQLAERDTCNIDVISSILVGGSKGSKNEQ